jgi:hypothetical protein
MMALEQLAEPGGKAEALLSDNGYYSESNVKACHGEDITPFIAAGREHHHLPLEQRWADPPPLAGEAEAMKHRLATLEGRAILWAAQMHGGTGVWHHQIGARLPPVSAARIESGVRRMDVGQHRLEFETDVQPAAAKAAGPRGLERGPG